MPDTIRVLLVEDSTDDALLVVNELRRGGLLPLWKRVDSADDYREAVKGPLDLILCDHSLPQFDSFSALQHLLDLEIDIPFIIVSGAIGEEAAVRAMKAGAHDYILKDNLSRLVPAIERELKEAGTRRERRKAQLALGESEERFRALLENSADGIVVYDADGQFTYLSPAQTSAFGYALQGVLANDSLESIHESDREKAMLLREKIFRMPGEVVAEELRIIHADGTWRDVACTARNLLADHAVNGIIFNFRDVTSRNEAEAARRRALAAEERDKFKTFLLSTVSHELRSPLAAIKGFATMLLDYDERVTGEERLANLQSIVGATSRLESLVADLLLLSSAEAGRLSLNTKAMDLQPMIEETLRSYEQTSPGRRFKVRASDSEVVVDAARIRQVLDNLIGNAIKYSPTDSEIEIAINPGDGELTLSVRDGGPGVPSEDLESIFEPFTRAVGAGQQFLPGSGLGLAICRSIVQAHGGRVWASLPEDGGFVVNLSLPTSQTGASSADSSAA